MRTKTISFIIALAGLSVLYTACHKDTPAPASTVALSLPDAPARYYTSSTPKINEKATLGRVLFYDGRLSLNNSISCASCHKQELAFSDNVALSPGYEGRLTLRNSLPIFNLISKGIKPMPSVGSDTNFTANSLLFWDGRENNVHDLVLRPISNHIEMGMEDFSVLPKKLAALPYYEKLFKDAYGTSGISLERISEAVALFISSIRAGNSRFGQYQKGKTNMLTGLEAEGMRLFTTKYDCGSCHVAGDTFSGYNDFNFMNNGLDKVSQDKGRGALRMLMDGMFKAPKLHNIALTAPYMHDGRFKTLDEVIDFYSTGIQGSENLASQLRNKDGSPRRMNINASEKQALIAFLNSMTDYSIITDPKFSNPFQAK